MELRLKNDKFDCSQSNILKEYFGHFCRALLLDSCWACRSLTWLMMLSMPLVFWEETFG